MIKEVYSEKKLTLYNFKNKNKLSMRSCPDGKEDSILIFILEKKLILY